MKKWNYSVLFQSNAYIFQWVINSALLYAFLRSWRCFFRECVAYSKFLNFFSGNQLRVWMDVMRTRYVKLHRIRSDHSPVVENLSDRDASIWDSFRFLEWFVAIQRTRYPKVSVLHNYICWSVFNKLFYLKKNIDILKIFMTNKVLKYQDSWNYLDLLNFL